MQVEYLAIKYLWATAPLLVLRVSLTHLGDESSFFPGVAEQNHNQFESYGQPIVDSCFTKFVFIMAWSFEILVEDSKIGGPSSITIRI